MDRMVRRHLLPTMEALANRSMAFKARTRCASRKTSEARMSHVVTSHEGIGHPKHLNQRGSLVNENMKYVNLRNRLV